MNAREIGNGADTGAGCRPMAASAKTEGAPENFASTIRGTRQVIHGEAQGAFVSLSRECVDRAG